MTTLLGFFDNPTQTTPAYDPGLAGVPCPICLRDLERPVVTISLCHAADAVGGAWKPGQVATERSYFFRAHKDCWSNATDQQKSEIESSIIDAGR